MILRITGVRTQTQISTVNYKIIIILIFFYKFINNSKHSVYFRNSLLTFNLEGVRSKYFSGKKPILEMHTCGRSPFLSMHAQEQFNKFTILLVISKL